MRIEVGNRVLSEVRGENKRVGALAATTRVVGASDQYCCSCPSGQNVVA